MLNDEYLPALNSFVQEQKIVDQLSHWLRCRIKLTQMRVHFGELGTSLNVNKVEINIHLPQFLVGEFTEAVPDISSLMNGDGIYYNLSVYPTHKVKPFTQCYKCGVKNIPEGQGYFFSRTSTYILCQACGFVPKDKRNEEYSCPPFKFYLYFVLSGTRVQSGFHDSLQILREEEYIPTIRERKHIVMCEICERQEFETIRFKCAVCRDINVCEPCLGKTLKVGDPKSTENIEKLFLKGCPGLTHHVFLTIYFNNTI